MNAIGARRVRRGQPRVRQGLGRPARPGDRAGCHRNATWDYLGANVDAKRDQRRPGAAGLLAVRPRQRHSRRHHGRPRRSASSAAVTDGDGRAWSARPGIAEPRVRRGGRGGLPECADEPQVTAIAANGEADIVRRQLSTPGAAWSGSARPSKQEVAKNGAFARMANMTGSVDAGHQRPHAPDLRLAGRQAPVGRLTRAYIQTGENPRRQRRTDQAHRRRRCCRWSGGQPASRVEEHRAPPAAADLHQTRASAQVKTIVDAALANAKVVGGQGPVGFGHRRTSRGPTTVSTPAASRSRTAARSRPLGDLVAQRAARRPPRPTSAKPDLGTRQTRVGCVPT